MSQEPQPTSAPLPKQVFISYAHKDEALRKRLDAHLSLLQRQGLIASWHDRQIRAGMEWAKEIDTHLEETSMILLLISADFVASDYCYGLEMNRALERQQAGQVVAIPIILKPVDWQTAPFARLQALPSNGKAITTWRNRDEAFADVAEGIRNALQQTQAVKNLANTDPNYDLSCWYLNKRRVLELVRKEVVTTLTEQNAAVLGESDTRLLALATMKDALIGWMQNQKPPSLGLLLLEGRALSGTPFTHYSNFYCRSNVASPFIHVKIEGLGRDTELRLSYDPAHLTANSSRTMLSGQHQLFVLGVIDSEQDSVLSAIPYIIATLIPMNPEALMKVSNIGHYWSNRLEVPVDDIDTFSLARDEPPPRKRDLDLLHNVPKEEVKRAFAEIIGEPTVPKDWGREYGH